MGRGCGGPSGSSSSMLVSGLFSKALLMSVPAGRADMRLRRGGRAARKAQRRAPGRRHPRRHRAKGAARCGATPAGGVCVYRGGSPQTPPLLPYVLTQQIQGGNTYKTKPSRVAAWSGCGWLEARRGVPSCRCPTLQSVPQDTLLLLAQQGPEPHGPWLLPRFFETLTCTVKRL